MGVPFVKEFDDLAENIANPNPNRPISNAVGQFGRQVCDRISARPDVFAPTILQSPLKAVCQPYWDGQGYDGPVTEPPFTGGQCAGVRYTVTGTFLNNTTGASCGLTQNWTAGNPFGPINGVVADGSFWNLSTAGGPIAINRTSADGGGRLGVGNPPCAGSPGSNVQRASEVKITSVVPVSGGANNCGDPPPETRPGDNPAPDPGPLPPGTGPQFDIRGNPFFVLPPTLEISPGFNFEFPIGEINLGSGTGNGAPSPPLPGEDSPGAGSGVGGGEDEFGEPPDGERWVGCCVTITNRPVGSGTIPQAEPESIYPRIIGNVRLKFRGESGGSEYDTPLENRQKTTCVWEPVRGLEPVGVRVNLLPGYEYSYRPYSVPLEQ